MQWFRKMALVALLVGMSSVSMNPASAHDRNGNGLVLLGAVVVGATLVSPPTMAPPSYQVYQVVPAPPAYVVAPPAYRPQVLYTVPPTVYSPQVIYVPPPAYYPDRRRFRRN